MGKRGPMPGTGGRPPKSLAEKLAKGNPGYKPIKVIPSPTTYEGVDMPKPSDYMRAKQKNGRELYAEEIFRDTWCWLVKCKCDHLFSTTLIEQYAMSFSRWIQCEEAISEFGFLAKHPTTGQAITSPYVGMSQSYLKQTNQLWTFIYGIVKANCSTDIYGATPHEDAMELLLSARERSF